jgi:hypothetical protein
LVVLLVAFTASVCGAQSNGVPASVTSFGFGGNRNTAPGVPASVTSSGPLGFGPGMQCCATRFFPPGSHPQPGDGNFHHHNNSGVFPGYVPIYTYGYYPGYSPTIVPQQEESTSTESVDAEDGAGPTVFDRTGSRRHPDEEAYSRGYEEGRAAAEDARPAHENHAAQKTSDQGTGKQDAKTTEPPAPAPAPAIVVKTVLVYRDGHKEEIANYAIVGDHLFDFTTGRRKIAIADLDVPASVKANDERGVDFQLPTVRTKK